MSNWWTPDPKEWEGQDAFLIGGGSSLSAFDFASLRGRNVIGTNDACRLGPVILKYNVFGDASWFARHKDCILKSGIVHVTNSPTLSDLAVENVHIMKRVLWGLGVGDELAWNNSTGAAAVNLAVSLGAVRIFLLGYDVSNVNQKSHWHECNTKLLVDYTFNRFQIGFKVLRDALPSYVRVFNVTDGSSQMEAFGRINFEAFQSVLQEQGQLVS